MLERERGKYVCFAVSKTLFMQELELDILYLVGCTILNCRKSDNVDGLPVNMLDVCLLIYYPARYANYAQYFKPCAGRTLWLNIV